MGSITKEYTSLLLDKVFYIALLGLGSYLIWQGDVVQRFHDSRTNFAVCSEPMIEMPTFNVTFFTSYRLIFVGRRIHMPRSTKSNVL